jgi:hypothetical protein
MKDLRKQVFALDCSLHENVDDVSQEFSIRESIDFIRVEYSLILDGRSINFTILDDDELLGIKTLPECVVNKMEKIIQVLQKNINYIKDI